MKLRIRNQSLRLRLTRSEVQALSDQHCVEATIQFGPMPSQKLVYRLVSTPNADQVRATFDNQTIEVKLPQAIAEAWTQSTDVGIYTEQSSQTHSPLKLLIEKDFFCLKPRSHEGYEKDDKSDMYPHPNAATGMC